MSYTNGGQTIDKSMNGIISYDTGGGVVIEGDTITADNITCDTLQVNGASTFNTALPTSTIATSSSVNELINRTIANLYYGQLTTGVTNTWASSNTYNAVLPTSTITTTTSNNQFITKGIGDALYSGGSLLGSNNIWTGTNSYNTYLPTSTLTGTPTATQIAPLGMLSNVLAPKASPTFTGSVSLPATTMTGDLTCNTPNKIILGNFSNNYIRNTGLDGATATTCNVEIACWNGLGFHDLISGTTKIYYDVRNGVTYTKYLDVSTVLSIGAVNVNLIFGRLAAGITNTWASSNTFNTVLPTSSITTSSSVSDFITRTIANIYYAPIATGGYARLTTVNNTFTNTNTFSGEEVQLNATYNVVQSKLSTQTPLPTLYVRNADNTKIMKFIANASVGALNAVVQAGDGVITADAVLTLTAEGATQVGIRILDTGVVDIRGTNMNINSTNLAISGSTATTFVALPSTTTTLTTATANQFITKSIGDTYYAQPTGGYARLTTVNNTFTNTNTFSGEEVQLNATYNVVQSKISAQTALPTLYIRNSTNTSIMKFIANASNNALNATVEAGDSAISAGNIPFSATSALTLTAESSTSVGIRIIASGVIDITGTNMNINSTNLAISAATITTFVGLPSTTTTLTTATANQFITKSIGDTYYPPKASPTFTGTVSCQSLNVTTTATIDNIVAVGGITTLAVNINPEGTMNIRGTDSTGRYGFTNTATTTPYFQFSFDYLSTTVKLKIEPLVTTFYNNVALTYLPSTLTSFTSSTIDQLISRNVANNYYGQLTTGVTNTWASTNVFNAILPTSTLTGTPTSTQIAPVQMLSTLYAPKVTGEYARLTTVDNSFTNNNTFGGTTTTINSTDTNINSTQTTFTSPSVITVNNPLLSLMTSVAETPFMKFYANVSSGIFNPVVTAGDVVIAGGSPTGTNYLTLVHSYSAIGTILGISLSATANYICGLTYFYQGEARFNDYLPTSTITTSSSVSQFITRTIANLYYGQLSTVNTWNQTQTMKLPITLSYTTVPTYTDTQIGFKYSSKPPAPFNGGTANTVYALHAFGIPSTGSWRIDAYVTITLALDGRFDLSIGSNAAPLAHDFEKVSAYAFQDNIVRPFSMMNSVQGLYSAGEVVAIKISCTASQATPPTVSSTYQSVYVITRIG